MKINIEDLFDDKIIDIKEIEILQYFYKKCVKFYFFFLCFCI